jgi:ribosomal protein L29
MKYKEKQNYNKTSIPELVKEVENLQGKLKKLTVDRHVKQLKNSREGRGMKKRIAVFKTFIKEKQLAS